MDSISTVMIGMICSFLFGAGVFLLTTYVQIAFKNRAQKEKNEISIEPKVKKTKKAVRDPKKSFGTMDIILVIIGVTLLVFTVLMIYIFITQGAVPDTLITCVFAVCGGECGVMGWIKTTKERQKERKWQLEDEKRNKEALAEGGKEASND